MPDREGHELARSAAPFPNRFRREVAKRPNFILFSPKPGVKRPVFSPHALKGSPLRHRGRGHYRTGFPPLLPDFQETQLETGCSVSSASTTICKPPATAKTPTGRALRPLKNPAGRGNTDRPFTHTASSDPTLVPLNAGMKIPGLLASVGLAISLVAPTVTQPKDTADPLTTQKIRAISQAYNEAVNRNDAAAVAALFTQDAVLVTDRAVIHGRPAIEKWYADLFQTLQPKELIGKPEGDAPYLIGTAGNAAYETGEWSETGEGPNGEPTQLNGYFSAVDVREGEDWKILMLTYNLTPSAPAPTPATPAGPGND